MSSGDGVVSLPARRKDCLNVIVAPTGSVASIKIPDLLFRLTQSGKFNVVLIPSFTATKFFSLSDVPNSVHVLSDSHEWQRQEDHEEEGGGGGGWTRGTPILHIELRKWVDVLLLAPLSAHTMAKITHGLCDTLVTEIVRAWDYSTPSSSPFPLKRIVAAPAMNTAMYTHPLTNQQLIILKETLGVHVLGPIEKLLACGDLGIGAMVEVDQLIEYMESLSQQSD